MSRCFGIGFGLGLGLGESLGSGYTHKNDGSGGESQQEGHSEGPWLLQQDLSFRAQIY